MRILELRYKSNVWRRQNISRQLTEVETVQGSIASLLDPLCSHLELILYITEGNSVSVERQPDDRVREGFRKQTQRNGNHASLRALVKSSAV